MLVFSDKKDLDEINRERIALHIQEVEQTRVQRKQAIYRRMADRQIEEVIAQIMSMANYDEKKYNLKTTVSQRTVSLASELSNSSDILNDSQDRIEDEDDDQPLKDSYNKFMKDYSLNY